MELYSLCRSGVNLGGWISQYSEDNAGHYDSFVTEEDIKMISEWGADHVRLPVDYHMVEDDEAPNKVREEGLAYIDACLEWCRKQGLNVVLDLHKAPGQVYGYDISPNPMLIQEEYAGRFAAIWKNLALRYKTIRDSLIFELLNEITDATGYLWNRLYPKVVEAIRREDPDRLIIAGSNDGNSVFALKELKLVDDARTIYNFHYYDPHMFTHQRAHFSSDMVAYDREILYPGEIPELVGFLDVHPEYRYRHARYLWEKNDRQLMEKYLENARDFIKYTGKQLYCGEFGVIGTAPEEAALRWVADLVEILDANRIGHCYWSYKEMDFGLVNLNREVVRPGLVTALFKALR